VYGVPMDLDITYLHGASLIQVCLGEYQLQFHFHPKGSISVEGRWELRDAAGGLLDRLYDGEKRPPYQLHRLLGQKVIGTEVSAPDWCAIKFEEGEVLRFFDDSKQFESFQIDGVIV
jgi:hypothetical protein